MLNWIKFTTRLIQTLWCITFGASRSLQWAVGAKIDINSKYIHNYTIYYIDVCIIY